MKRREFLFGTAGLFGTTLTSIAQAEERPCPPPTLQAVGGSAVAEPCVSPTPGSVPGWLRDMPVARWFEIPNTKLSEAQGYSGGPMVWQDSGPDQIIKTWCGACLRPPRDGLNSSVYLIGGAGGHNDGAGNHVMGLLLNTETPRWKEIGKSSLTSAMVSGIGSGNYIGNFNADHAGVYLDFRPAATHTYNSMQYVQLDDRLAVFGNKSIADSDYARATDQWMLTHSGRKTVGSFHAKNWAQYDSGNDWDIRPSAGGVTYWPDIAFSDGTDLSHISRQEIPEAIACSVDQATGNVYLVGQKGQVIKFTRSNQTWTIVRSDFGDAGGSATSVDTERRRVMFLGRRSTTGPRFCSLDSPAFADIGATFNGSPLPASVLSAESYSGCVYDPDNDRHIAFLNKSGSGGQFEQYTVTCTGGVNYHIGAIPLTAVSGSTVPDINGTMKAGHAFRNGIHNAIQYVPELKGIVFADQGTDNVHFMRTA